MLFTAVEIYNRQWHGNHVAEITRQGRIIARLTLRSAGWNYLNPRMLFIDRSQVRNLIQARFETLVSALFQGGSTVGKATLHESIPPAIGYEPQSPSGAQPQSSTA